jgi:hypothetical protein
MPWPFDNKPMRPQPLNAMQSFREPPKPPANAMAQALMGRQSKQPDADFGYGIRRDLYPGENNYFAQNPQVAGMAAETGDVILNPHSSPDVNRDAVAKNESLRLLLRDLGMTPDFPLTDQQRGAFRGTAYQGQEGPMRETIAARIYSGDKSAYATPEQTDWLARFLKERGL